MIKWKDGKLKLVLYSKWDSPIVIVSKPAGTIRMCAEYKCTVNLVIKNDTYPQPTPEELFLKIKRGENFSKTDLTEAYLQVKLDDESQKCLKINTSQGLKQPTRISYGVKPATGIFQIFIENAAANIPYSGFKVDGILISGKTDHDHLANIEKVFRVLKEIGAMLKQKFMYIFLPKR